MTHRIGRARRSHVFRTFPPHNCRKRRNFHKHRALHLLSRRYLLPIIVALIPPLLAAEGDRPAAVLEADIEEVVVTAELQPTPWLTQPASSSVVTAATLSARAATHLENVLLLTPNVNIAGGSSRARFYQLRGIGERSQFVEPLNPSVGLLLDNIDFSGLGTLASVYDIAQVEVLRGPQGTLHGANALAGLINLRSAAPTEGVEARLNTTIGDYGRQDLGAVLSGPLTPELLGRLAVHRHRSDGFIRNRFLGRDDTNGRDEQLYRGRLRWLPGGAQQLDLTLLYSDIDNGYDAFSLDNTRETLSDRPGRDRQRSQAAAVDWTRRGDHVALQLLASAADSATEYSYDEDWSFEGIAPGLEYASFDRYLRDRRSYSAQLRVASAQPLRFAGRPVDAVAGVYLLDDDEALQRQYTYLDRDFFSRFQARTAAAFGQLDISLADGWALIAGLRLAQRCMDYSDSNRVDSQPEDSLWGGKLALSYESEQLGYFYATLSRGYRAGGVNAGILAQPEIDGDEANALQAQRFFDPELLYSLEIGHKARFLDDRVSSALALFAMERRDQQVRGSLVIPRDDGSTAFVDFTDNAASGYNRGAEWELRLQPEAAVQAYLNLGLLWARFDDYLNADGRDLGGRDQAHAPRYQFALGVDVSPAPGWILRAEWEGRDAFYFSDRHQSRAPAYELLHLRAAYATERWELALWARNLLDTDYFIRGFGSFGNDPRKGYVVEDYRQFGDPRQLGLSLELRF